MLLGLIARNFNRLSPFQLTSAPENMMQPRWAMTTKQIMFRGHLFVALFFLFHTRVTAFSNVPLYPSSGQVHLQQVLSYRHRSFQLVSKTQVEARSEKVPKSTISRPAISAPISNSGSPKSPTSRLYRALPILAAVLGATSLSFWASSILIHVSRLYKAYPLAAAFITCSIKASAADRMAQWRDVCTTEFCLRRNLAMVLYSGTVLGITVEIMYNTAFPWMFGAGSSLAKVIKMTLFDSLINAPLLWLPPAYLMQALISRYPKRDALAKYVRDVRENGLLTKYWSLWLPASFLNFLAVPPHFRVAFVAAVSFFWMIVLSLVANNNQDPKSCPVDASEPVLLNPRAFD